MVAYYHNNESKSLIVSFLAHAVLIGGYFLFLHQQSLTLMHSTKTVVMELSTFERPPAPKQLEPTPPKVEPVRDLKPEPVKPLEPIKQKHKEQPRRKVQEPINPMPIQEEVTQPTAAEPTNTLPVAQEIPIMAPAQSIQAEPFVKTDFEIIRDKVLSHLVYPSIAKRMNWNGVVHVALVIDSSGYLLSASIHQSSGRDILDNAALDAANKLKNQQLPKPQSTSTVILPIAFKLR